MANLISIGNRCHALTLWRISLPASQRHWVVSSHWGVPSQADHHNLAIGRKYDLILESSYSHTSLVPRGYFTLTIHSLVKLLDPLVPASSTSVPDMVHPIPQGIGQTQIT